MAAVCGNRAHCGWWPECRREERGRSCGALVAVKAWPGGVNSFLSMLHLPVAPSRKPSL